MAQGYRGRVTRTDAEFDSLYRHGFARVAVAVPQVQVADVAFNVAQTITLARQADEDGAAVVVFPELGITAYSNDDLFQQDALLDGALEGLMNVVRETAKLRPLVLVGVPVRHDGALFNAAVAVHRGTILGVTPKSFVPNYREFYEKRQFASGRAARSREIDLLDFHVPFGSDIIYQATTVDNLCVHAEVCEDVWVPIPPSTYAAMGGATVLANLSASNITIGKASYRRSLGADQSARCIAAYLYTAAGDGESSTDLAWDGDAHIHENGHLLAEAKRFTSDSQVIAADIHLSALAQDRMRMTSFQDSADAHRDRISSFRTVHFSPEVPGGVRLRREVARFPYVPSNDARRDERCFEAYNIQVAGLVKRLRATCIKKLVIGISGGLDSTQALLVSVRAMDLLDLPRTNILAYTMPGFATSERTLRDAHELMRSLGVTAAEIDITESCMQMFRDIDHPYARGEKVYDVAFENVQAGERASHLFRLANLNGGLVVGTGDLSELALGWATYGIGDHMSHYAVNASVPKTLIQHLIRWVAETHQFGEAVSAVLLSVLDTEISPELIPGHEGARDSDGQPAQHTEKTIGPYELHDFFLYYITRYGMRPSSVAYLARLAWSDRDTGNWPSDILDERRNEYDLAVIKKWLSVFLRRFFGSTQFKRSCIPNGPKVGSGGSLSPRGDWRAPSDSVPDTWLKELEANVPDA